MQKSLLPLIDMYIKNMLQFIFLDIYANKVELESKPTFSLSEILSLSSGIYFSIKPIILIEKIKRSLL